MKKPYCCDASRDLYERYYDLQQSGKGEFPVYVGAFKQRGHGLGDILRGLWRRIVPIFKSFAPHVLRAGANIVEDVASGKTWKESAFQRVPEVIRTATSGETLQSGSGHRRKRTKRKSRIRKRIKCDILS